MSSVMDITTLYSKDPNIITAMKERTHFRGAEPISPKKYGELISKRKRKRRRV